MATFTDEEIEVLQKIGNSVMLFFFPFILLKIKKKQKNSNISKKKFQKITLNQHISNIFFH